MGQQELSQVCFASDPIPLNHRVSALPENYGALGVSFNNRSLLADEERGWFFADGDGVGQAVQSAVTQVRKKKDRQA